jgi:hypothetical protein
MVAALALLHKKRKKDFHSKKQSHGKTVASRSLVGERKIFFRLSALCVFPKALNQEGSENAVHYLDSLFLTAPMITIFY